MKKRFTEEQIVGMLGEAADGMSARDVCRKHNVAEPTFYRWKAKYAGMEASEVKERSDWLECPVRRLLTICRI